MKSWGPVDRTVVSSNISIHIHAQRMERYRVLRRLFMLRDASGEGNTSGEFLWFAKNDRKSDVTFNKRSWRSDPVGKVVCIGCGLRHASRRNSQADFMTHGACRCSIGPNIRFVKRLLPGQSIQD